MRAKTRDQVITEAIAIHGNTITFDHFVLNGMDKKSDFTCVIHGNFPMKPHNLITGKQGCPSCASLKRKQKLTRTKEDFVKEARLVHGNKYNYDKAVYVNNQTKMGNVECTACGATDIYIIPTNHLRGVNHKGCTTKNRKKRLANTVRDLQRKVRDNMEEWKYLNDWDERTLLNGSYSAFVYQFRFEDGSHYIGVKQLYQRVKTYKKIKHDSKENGWREYSSSSKIVNQKIADGENYTRTILYAFPTMDEAMLVELSLILSEGLKYGSLNLATMHKCKLPNAEGKARVYGILQELWEYLN